MFGIFRTKPDFEKIFSSHSAIEEFIYGDKNKTSTILGDSEFVDAWLSSRNSGKVSAVINEKALSGDIPSLKQMIWLCEVYYDGAESLTKDSSQIIELKTKCMQDRVMFCEKAINSGLKDQSYYAMTSSAKLYLLRFGLPGSLNDQITRNALSDIVRYAKMFVDSGSREQELIADAKSAIKHYGPLLAILGVT